MARRGIFLNRTASAIGGRGIEVRYNEHELADLFGSAHGPTGRYLDEHVGPTVAQESKRIAPTSPDGSHGRPSGYLRSTIGHEVGADDDGVYVDIGSHALTPDGTDYGYIVEVGHYTPAGTFVPPQSYLRDALRVV